MTTATTKSPGLSKSNSFTPVTTTLVDGTEVVVVLQGVALPRSLGIRRASGDTITVKWRLSATDDWQTFGAYTADTQITLSSPVQAISVQRTSGTGTTSKAVFA